VDPSRETFKPQQELVGRSFAAKALESKTQKKHLYPCDFVLAALKALVV